MQNIKQLIEYQRELNNEKNFRVQAEKCRTFLGVILKQVYEDAGIEYPKSASMLEVIDGEVVKKYFTNNRELLQALHFIRTIGMHAIHDISIKKKDAQLAADNVLSILKYIECKEREDLSAYKNPDSLSEYETRKIYIDTYLREAGWEILEIENQCVAGKAGIEIKVEGMPNSQGIGFCDYVLFGRDGKPLAIIEAKKTSVSPEKGRHQVDLYAECMKRIYGYKPVLYYTNGYTIKVIDGIYPDRSVAGFHTIAELELLLQKRNRGDITDFSINDEITNRTYQKTAVTAMCERLNEKQRRGLLVMATGTGKTRVSISLVDILTRNNWVKNVLFLADRTALVNQAKRAFSKMLPNMSVCVLSDKSGDKDLNSRLMFSTYQTMINYIDAENKAFSIGRFDLIIIDEAHRSIFNKYGSIFNYYDSILVGLTATPKDEVDANTYRIFGCESGIPTSDYSLDDAVKEHYLVPYEVINKTTAILDRGIKYKELSKDEQEQLDEYLVDTNRPELEFDVPKSDIFSKLYNKDTCRKVLEDLMLYGQKVEQGELLGKTIIFAYNHMHAQMIVDCFHEMYPKYSENYCQLVDNYVKYADDLVLKFGEDPEFRIAVSVDMLDTGVDITEILNLVFFKPVKSKTKFVQMIGRGTRLHENLFGVGQDKKKFIIFDYCGNFEYFDENPDGATPNTTYTLSQRLFDIRLDLLHELQREEFQSDPFYREYYASIKNILQDKVKEIKSCDKQINVRLQMDYVDKYCVEDNWAALSPVMVKEIKNHITPLISGGLEDDYRVLSFDARVLNIEVSLIISGDIKSAAEDVKVVRSAAKYLLEEKASIPDVFDKRDVLRNVSTDVFWNSPKVSNLENIRAELRALMTYIEKTHKTWNIDIHDASSDATIPGSAFAHFDIRTYKEKVIDYLAEHLENAAVIKIKNLEPINAGDLRELERILWEELGSKDEYNKYSKSENVAAFIRSLVGLDNHTINAKLSEFVSKLSLNSRQQEYLNSIVNYVRENGDITKEDLVNKSPFSNIDLLELFGEKISAVVGMVELLHDTICVNA